MNWWRACYYENVCLMREMCKDEREKAMKGPSKLKNVRKLRLEPPGHVDLITD